MELNEDQAGYEHSAIQTKECEENGIEQWQPHALQQLRRNVNFHLHV
jgi:hypothetical protein